MNQNANMYSHKLTWTSYEVSVNRLDKSLLIFRGWNYGDVLLDILLSLVFKGFGERIAPCASIQRWLL